MRRYMTSGVVVLADDHPHSQGTIDTARAYAGHRYAVGHDVDSRFGGFDEVLDPGRDQPTVAATFKEAARRRIPWVALRRDLAPPAELLGQLLDATARRTSKELPGFVVLLTSATQRSVRRILAVVDRSDGQPSGLLALAAVAAAEQTGAALDVLVIGAPNEELNSSALPDTILRVARDKDLYEQAKRRSASLGARGNWMFIDNVEDRVQLVRDVLAAQEYDVVIDDLGNVNLGGRVGRRKRIGKTLRPGGPASITLSVLETTDLPTLLVLDAVWLGLIPAKVKVGAGASVLALGVMVSAAPKAAAGPVQREQAQTTISQTVEDYDAALTAAANLATPAEVEEAQSQAQASGDEAEAVIASVDSEATETAEQSADESQQADDEQASETPAESEADEQQASESQPDEQAGEDQSADEQAGEDQSADEHAAESQTADEQTGDEQTADQADGGAAAGVESEAADVSPSELSPEDVKPEKGEKADTEDVEVADDVSQEDVSDATEEADESKEALDEAQEEFDQTQEAAIEAKAAAEDASAAAVQASSDLDQANEAYEQVSEQTGDVVADATGVSGALPGGATEEEMATAEAEQVAAFAELEAAGQQADEALQDYESAATAAVETSAELDAAAEDVTAAQTEYNEDQATADATEGAYQEKMADARVSPVAEGEYTESAHYGDSGSMWSTGYHTGEDYAAPIGTDVMAAASGTVVEAGSNGAYGNQVVIEHENGYYTTYSHLSEIDVTVGQEVTAGDTIGAVGNTGNSSGPHLHFEVTQGGDGWSGGSFVDPHAWLEGEVG